MFAMKTGSSTFVNNTINYRTANGGPSDMIPSASNIIPGITNAEEIWSTYVASITPLSVRSDFMSATRCFFLHDSFYSFTFSYILGSSVTLTEYKITSTGVTAPVSHNFSWPTSAAVGSFLSLGADADCELLCVYVDRSNTNNRCIALIRSVVSGSYGSQTHHVWGCELTLQAQQISSTSTIPGTTVTNFLGLWVGNSGLNWAHVPNGDGLVVIGLPWYNGSNPHPLRWYWCRIRNGSVVVDSMIRGSYSNSSINAGASDRGYIVGDKRVTLFTLRNSVFLFEADMSQLSYSRLYKIDFSDGTTPVMTRVRNAFASDANLHASAKNFSGTLARDGYFYMRTIVDPQNDGSFESIDRRFRLEKLYPSTSTDNDGKCDYSDGFQSSEINDFPIFYNFASAKL